MTLLSRSLLLLGSVLLLHAYVLLRTSARFPLLTSRPRAYSAHEHSALLKLSSANVLPTTSSADGLPFHSPAAAPLSAGTSLLAQLPPDIALETLIAVALLGAALVLGAESLRPVRWAEWAAGEEQARRRWMAGKGLAGPADEEASHGEFGAELRGYEGLENGCRRGFVDIRVSLISHAFVMQFMRIGVSIQQLNPLIDRLKGKHLQSGSSCKGMLAQARYLGLQYPD